MPTTLPKKFWIPLIAATFLLGGFLIAGLLGPYQIDQSPGFHSCRWIDDAGVVHRYVLFVPYGLKSNIHPPLILFLNGLGQDGSDGIQQARANFGPAIWGKRSSFPFLAVFPQCSAQSSWTRPDNLQVNKALSILDEVTDQFSVNKDQIFLTGPSSGGSGVWHVAAANPDRFAAIVPMCGYASSEAIRAIANAGLPVWNLWCIEDRSSLVKHNHELMQLLRDHGQSPFYTETQTPEFFHDCWNVGYRLPPIYEWMLEQRQNHNGQRPKFKPLNQRAEWTGWSGISERGWNFNESNDEPHFAFPGAKSSKKKPWLRRVELSEQAEMHLEYQGNCKSSLLIGLLNKHGSVRDVYVEICPSKLGDGGLYLTEPTTWLAPLDSISQSQLQQDGWNDIRVSVDAISIKVLLNGWVALDATRDESWPEEFNLALRTDGTSEGQVTIRRIRLREAQ